METFKDIMDTTFRQFEDSVKANYVVGNGIVEGENVVLPISKVSFGFVLGGGEWQSKKNSNSQPVANASGGGMTVTPIGFLVCGERNSFVPVEQAGEENKWMNLAKSVMDVLKKN